MSSVGYCANPASVVLVTGGTRGIGLATSRMFRDRGSTVIVCARTPPVHDVRTASNIEFIKCDVSDKQQVTAMFEKIAAQHGRLDVLVNNAACMTVSSLADTRDVDVDMVLNTNLRGPLWCMQHALTLMGDRGLIINLTSSCLDGGRAMQGIYGASKAALSTLSDCLVHELRAEGRGIGVIQVMPRRTDTQMRRDNFPLEGGQGCLQPEEVAQAVFGAYESYAQSLAHSHPHSRDQSHLRSQDQSHPQSQDQSHPQSQDQSQDQSHPQSHPQSHLPSVIRLV